MHLVLASKMWPTGLVSQGVAFAALPSELLVVPEGSDYSSDLHPDWEDLKQTHERLDTAMEVWLQQVSPEFFGQSGCIAPTQKGFSAPIPCGRH